MSLKEKIAADFKQAFKEKNMQKKGTLSMLQSEIRNKEIELIKREAGLSDEEIVQLIARMIKQRKDSIDQYKIAGRDELAAQEEKEVLVLLEYMPEQLGDEEIEKSVKAAVEESGAASKADIGKVMSIAMSKLRGKADGNKVREIAEKLLS